MNDLQRYIAVSKYARWLEDEERRETWEETVDRYIGFFRGRCKMGLDGVRGAILNLEVMPSMRALMTAGPALDRDNASGFNCAGIAVDHHRVFDEIFYLLMCGCGVGFSVERQYINKLPTLPEELHDADTIITVGDSKIGWAKGLKELISLLYSGSIPKWDLSRIRPAGARLKTFGGRASGPEPLNSLFNFVVATFNRATKENRERLNSIQVHDIVCKIADTVIAGSVRRSACISLSNLTDDRMRRAKTGDWWNIYPYRALANNSVAYTEKPDLDSFSKEWRTLYKSKSGERGIVNKEALREKAEGCGREWERDYLLNPCGEAILRDSGGLCNLSEVVVRPDDTVESLARKVKLATICGTLQSTLTDFRYLRKVWRDNAEEERLLGISLTGIMDHKHLSNKQRYIDVMGGPDNIIDTVDKLKFAKEINPDYGYKLGDKPMEDVTWSLEQTLAYLRSVAERTNREWAKKLGIQPSKQLTLVKPSGTVSQLCNTSSGIHPRFSKHYIRRVIQDNKDVLTNFLIDQEVPYVKQGEKTIFSFYVAAPKDCITADDMTAMEQLELWKIYREHWCDGNPSQTIYYGDDEYFAVAQWVWENWSIIGGLSFFPKDDHIYENAPFEKISKEQWTDAMSCTAAIDWDKLGQYEQWDQTTGSQEFACAGGACEI